MNEGYAIITSLLGGLGIGSLLTVLLKERYENKKLVLKEKMEAYCGFIDSLQHSVANSSEEARQKVVYWQKRLELIAPGPIVALSKTIYDGSNTAITRDTIVLLMRDDLGIA